MGAREKGAVVDERKYIKENEKDVESFDVFVHEFLVKFRSERVVDEFFLVFVEIFCAIFENDVVVPSTGHFEVGIGRVGTFVEEGIAVKDIFRTNALLFHTLLFILTLTSSSTTTTTSSTTTTAKLTTTTTLIITTTLILTTLIQQKH